MHESRTSARGRVPIEIVSPARAVTQSFAGSGRFSPVFIEHRELPTFTVTQAYAVPRERASR